MKRFIYLLDVLQAKYEKNGDFSRVRKATISK